MFLIPRTSTALTNVCLVMMIFVALACNCELGEPGNGGNQLPQKKSATTVILVRHAEKESEPADDPNLNVTGQVRAQILANVLADKGISAIYATNYRRTQQTAEPLATKLNIKPVLIDDARAVAEAIVSKNAGQTVLVVGHTNTIPEIIRQLDGGEINLIAENEFEKMFIVTVPADFSESKVVESKY